MTRTRRSASAQAPIDHPTTAPGAGSTNHQPGAFSRRRLLADGARLSGLAAVAGVARRLRSPGALLTHAARLRQKTVVRTSQVHVGSAFAFTNPFTEGPAYVVHPAGSTFRAFSAICPHEGCTVNFAGPRFVCPCHGSQFDSSTGALEHGPARRGLTEIPVVVTDGEVRVER